MTAMRNGVYALLAVVVGVMLIGLLPNQLSNLVTPIDIVNLQNTSKEATGNLTLGGTSPSRTTDTVNNTKTDSTHSPSTTSDGILTADKNSDPYADLIYYRLWGIGLVAALAVYFAAKRMLG